MKQDWMKELTLEMIPQEYRDIAEIIGVDKFLQLAEHAGGTSPYIPKKERILIPIRDQKIRNEYTGYNVRELARKYNLSEQWIREICKDDILEGQINLFEAK